MRELKFRAWAEVDGIKTSCTDMMVYFEPMQCDNGMWFNAPDNVYHINEYHSLMQYTGLKDKNGADVYEGDYLRHKESIFKIDYSELDFGFVFWHPKLKEDLGLPYLKGLKDFEIVGNIYQNPELINN